MSKLDELIRELCPDGVECVKLGTLCSLVTKQTGFDYTNHIKARLLMEPAENAVPYIQTKFFAGKNFNYQTDYYVPMDIVEQFPKITLDEKCILFSIVGASIGNVGLFPGERKCFLGGAICVAKVLPQYDVDYIYYCVEAHNVQHQIRRKTKGAGQATITVEDIREFEIPLLPLEVQREIVRILDDYTENVTELQRQLAAEMTARKTQYSFYRDKLLTFNTPVEWKPMEKEFPFIRNGFVGTVTPYFTGEEQGVRYLEGTNIHDGMISDNEIIYVSKEFHQKHIRNELKDGDILMVQSGHVGECAVVDDKYAGSNCHALIIMSNAGRCNSRFVMHYLRSTEGKAGLKKITTGETVKHILASNMKKFMIPVPPLDVQNRIVNVLDNFEKICSDLNIGLPAEIEARQKQYEYYRDKLLTFVETGNTILSRAEQSRAEQSRAEQSRALIKLMQYVFGYAMLPLSEIANVFRGEYITKKNEKAGNVPVILGGQEPAYYIDRANHTGEIVAVARSGASAGFVSYWDEPIFITDGFGYEVKKEVAIPKYLYYVLKNKEIELNGMKRGAGVPHVSGKRLGEINLPVPPIEEQKRVVSILDRFDAICNDLTSGLPAEIEARQRQYEYYRDKLLTFKERG